MFAEVRSASLNGLDGVAVTVEANLSQGLPGFAIVGLPDAAVREARERIRAAVENSGYCFPARRIVVNLSPANVRKEGTHFDLAISSCILLADGVIKSEALRDYAFLGELSLDGQIRAVPGVLPLVMGLREQGFSKVVLPEGNGSEAAMVQGMEIYPAARLGQIIGAFARRKGAPRWEEQGVRPLRGDLSALRKRIPAARDAGDFAEVAGQEVAKRALMIAAAGFHNVLMVGPPGAGKTMLARRVPGILPPLQEEEMLEVTRIYSVAGELNERRPLVVERPFRAPHHSISGAALAGGGSRPRPGEVSLAHKGVLFLDELPEFSRQTLELLRQPLEDKEITIARIGGVCRFPSDFFLLAAMNPCPCGYYGHPKLACSCTEHQIRSYLGKLSGPLLDRIDIQIEIYPPDYDALERFDGMDSAAMAERVRAARERQLFRYRGEAFSFNGQLPSARIEQYCGAEEAGEALLRQAFEHYALSARALQKLRRLSRSIADLEGEERISAAHCAEALQYQSFARRREAMREDTWIR